MRTCIARPACTAGLTTHTAAWRAAHSLLSAAPHPPIPCLAEECAQLLLGREQGQQRVHPSALASQQGCGWTGADEGLGCWAQLIFVLNLCFIC